MLIPGRVSLLLNFPPRRICGIQRLRGLFPYVGYTRNGPSLDSNRRSYIPYFSRHPDGVLAAAFGLEGKYLFTIGSAGDRVDDGN